MKPRVFVTFLASLALSVTVCASPVAMTLITDSGEHTGISVVHRISSDNGAYLGYFGAGHLKHAGPIAVCTPYVEDRDTSSFAFVADDEGIKRFNVATGGYVNMISTIGQGKVVAMAFGDGRTSSSNEWIADPSLWVVLKTDFIHYKLRRYDTATRAVLAESSLTNALFTGAVSLSCGYDGTVDVMYNSGLFTCEDRFSGNGYQVTKPILAARPAIFAMDAGDYRARSGPFVRTLANGELRSGVGYLNGGIHLGWVGLGRYVGMADSDEFHLTDMVTDVNYMLVAVTGYYVSIYDHTVKQVTYPLYSAFKHDTLRGVAHYSDPATYIGR